MVYPHMHLKDISNQEKTHAWRTRHDEISSREHMNLTVMWMRMQEGEEMIPKEYEDYCSRGLEYMIDINEYQERVQRGKQAVMGVQEFLRHRYTEDKGQVQVDDAQDMIAAIYKACTCQATDIAHKFGQSDFDAIQL